MAIYHFAVQVLSRTKGRSSVIAAAYRSGSKFKDERLNQSFDYSKKSVDECFIIAPSHSPNWVYQRERLWNQIELVEKRKDAQLCREFNIALPVELRESQQTELVLDYCKRNFVDRGMIADVCIHRDNPNNPHVHVMTTLREVTNDGFGKKNRKWNSKDLIEEWRKDWADATNECLLKNGFNEQIDHRSYKRQGRDILPTIHIGYNALQLERRGVKTKRGDINREVMQMRNKVYSIEKSHLDTDYEALIPQLNSGGLTPKEKLERVQLLKEQKKKNAVSGSTGDSTIREIVYEKLKLQSDISKTTALYNKLKSDFLVNSSKINKYNEYNAQIKKIKEEIRGITPKSKLEKLVFKFSRKKKEQHFKKNELLKSLNEKSSNLSKQLPKVIENLEEIRMKMENLSLEYPELLKEKKNIDIRLKNTKKQHKSIKDIKDREKD